MVAPLGNANRKLAAGAAATVSAGNRQATAIAAPIRRACMPGELIRSIEMTGFIDRKARITARATIRPPDLTH
ncbi:MAG: hypothetical protein VB137_10750 [Burkholderia sp.]